MPSEEYGLTVSHFLNIVKMYRSSANITLVPIFTRRRYQGIVCDNADYRHLIGSGPLGANSAGLLKGSPINQPKLTTCSINLLTLGGA